MSYRRRRPNAKFYILIGLLLALMCVVTFCVANKFGGTIGSDTIEMSLHTDIVIVRDELTATSESYGKVAYDTLEGQQVEGGTKVAEVYMWGYNDNTLQDLSALEQEIYNYQTRVLMEDVVDADLQSMNSAVDQKKEQIAQRIRGKSGDDLLELENQLSGLIEQRRAYLKNTVQPDETLSDMYAQKAEYENSLKTWKRDVLSTGAGRISFHFDGYEPILNKQSLSQIQPKDVTTVSKGKTLANAASLNQESEKPLYRLVNPSEWYAVIATDKRNTSRLVEGEQYEIKFDGDFDKTYKGQAIVATRYKDAGGVYAIRVQDSVNEVLSLRSQKGTITAAFTGLSVNSSAITNIDGKEGIYVKVGGEKLFVPVEVLHMNDKKAVFRSDNPAVTSGVYYYNN